MTAGSAAATHQPASGAFAYGGLTGDVFVTGDWKNSGISTAGIYRSGIWILDLSGQHTGDTFFGYGGLSIDVPVPGKW